jgi:hypothetical protein
LRNSCSAWRPNAASSTNAGVCCERQGARLGDPARGDRFLGGGVQAGAARRRFDPEPEQRRGIQAMHRGPPVLALARVSRDALLARDLDQPRHEAMVAVAVHGR